MYNCGKFYTTAIALCVYEYVIENTNYKPPNCLERIR